MSQEIISAVSTPAVSVPAVRTPSMTPPQHDTPQINLDTGAELKIQDTSPLEEISKKEISSSEKYQKYAPKAFWKDHVKKEFSGLNPKTQKAWLDSFSLLEKSYGKIINDMKQSYLALDDVAGVLAPYLPQIINEQKISPAEYIAGLIEADAACTANPIKYILQIMSARGITFEDLGAGITPLVEESRNIKKLSPVLNRIEQLERRLEQQPIQSPQMTEAQQLEYETDVAAAEIKNFYGQTDSSGRELYPNWKNYIADILPQYLGGESLDDAYNNAVAVRGAKIPTNTLRSSDVQYPDSYTVSPSEKRGKQAEIAMYKNVVEKLKEIRG
jgi:hypothetical protein